MKMVVYLICAAVQTGVVLAQNSAVPAEEIEKAIRELRERRMRIQEELSRMRAPQPRQGPDSQDAPSAAPEPSAGSRNDPTPTGSSPEPTPTPEPLSANAASRSSPSAAVPTAAPEASSALSVRPSPTEVDGLLKHGRELFAAGDI